MIEDHNKEAVIYALLDPRNEKAGYESLDFIVK